MNQATQSKGTIQRFFKKHGFSILLVLPLVIFIFSFTLVPIFQTITLSFKTSASNVSLDNYQNIIHRGNFIEATTNTLLITALGLTLQMTIGYFLASLLRKTFVGKGLARTLVLLPMGVPTIVSGIAMLYIFSTNGYLNEILYRLNISSIPIDWTATRFRSLIVIAIADTWKVMPMVVLLILSGLESIPRETYEAADVDGAGKMAQFFNITLPQLKATVTMTVLTRVVDLFRIFELPKVLNGYMPFSATIAYDEYSRNNYGNSAAASTLLLLMIVIVVSLYMFFVEREKKEKHV